MKKTLFILAALMALCFAGCGKSNNASSPNQTASAAPNPNPGGIYDSLGLPSDYFPTDIGRRFVYTVEVTPGLDALTAAVTPITTPYLYYLSDRDGNMHYAKTFEEHVKNKERYLR